MGRMSKTKKTETLICGTTKKERDSVINEIAALSKDCGKDVILIGEGEEANALAAAIIGYDSKTYAVIYDYDKLVEAMSQHTGMTQEETIEWIDYNTMRALDYIVDSDKQVGPRISAKFNI